MTDPHHLKDTANGLRLLYHRIQDLKTQAPTPNTDGTIYRPQPGPRSPLNTHWQNLEDELINERQGDPNKPETPGGLLKMVIDAAQYVGTPPHHKQALPNGIELCTYVATHAHTITQQFPAADDLNDLMTQQAHYLHQKIGDPPTTPRPEPRQTLNVLIHQLQALDHWISPDRIRNFAKNGHITTQKLPNGRNGYLLTETLKHLQGQP